MQLAAIVFFTVSGGPYGLEPLLGYAGTHGALLLLLITPLLWDVPAILTVLELNGMMPVTGMVGGTASLQVKTLVPERRKALK